MNVDQHLKVAQFHIEKARQHAAEDGFKCGCPLNDEHQKAIDAMEAAHIDVSKKSE